MAPAALEVWSHEFLEEVNRNSFATTLGLDSCYFLLCVACDFCCKKLARWKLARQATGGSASSRRAGVSARPASPLLSAETPGEASVRERALSKTALNYLAFLNAGKKLFLVLSLIGLPSSIYMWGVSPLAAGASLRRLDRTRFHAPGGCQHGLPNTSAGLRCSASIHAGWTQVPFSSDEWVENQTVPYSPNTTLSMCEYMAQLCNASALVFNQRPGVDTGECWSLNVDDAGGAAALLPTPGAIFCQGHRDFLPGRLMFVLSLLYGACGIVACISLVTRLHSEDPGEIQRLTIWLRELPTADREDGVCWSLDEPDFLRVSRDLKEALTLAVNKRLEREGIAKPPFDKEEKVLNVYTVHAQGNEKHLAGHAFAVMTREAYVSAILQPHREPFLGLECLRWVPTWVRWRSHSLFKFGKPPFSAVTLRCQRAPPPSDIIWENLHLNKGRWCRRWVLQGFLVIISLLLAPVSLAGPLYALIGSLQSVHVIHKAFPDSFWAEIGSAAENLPSYFLLLLNSVVLPCLIQILSDLARPFLRSRSEVTQFRTNNFFLVLNSLLVPLLGFLTTSESLWKQGLAYISKLDVQSDRWKALKEVGVQGLQAPSGLMLKYLANAALVTTGSQLIQLGKGVARRCLCLPNEPWPFAWGYWYAWAHSALLLALTLGVVMPTTLPLAALFFLLMEGVHRTNLQRGDFDTSLEMDRVAEMRIARLVLNAVCSLWAVMALFFYSQPHMAGERVLQVWFPTYLPEPGATLLPVPMLGEVVWGQQLLVPVRLIIFALLVDLAIAICLTSILFQPGSRLERWLFVRRGGYALNDFFNFVLKVAFALVLWFSWGFRPHFCWERTAVLMHDVAAGCLASMALGLLLLSSVGSVLETKFVRMRTGEVSNLLRRSRASDALDLDALRAAMKEDQALCSFNKYGIATSPYRPMERQGTRQGHLEDMHSEHEA